MFAGKDRKETTALNGLSNAFLYNEHLTHFAPQLTFTWSISKIKKLEKDLSYVQS